MRDPSATVTLAANPLRYLILLEGGVVALLATALAKHDDTEASHNQRRFWQGFADICGLELSSDGPQYVAVERYRIDLLAVWDHWAILLEAKTKAEHVKDGQLQRYYDRLRSKLGTKDLSNASSIGVVFLTPTGVGDPEFKSLTVQASDRKEHIYWNAVLELIDSAFSAPASDERNGMMPDLIALGSKRIRELLIPGGIARAARPSGPPNPALQPAPPPSPSPTVQRLPGGG